MRHPNYIIYDFEYGKTIRVTASVERDAVRIAIVDHTGTESEKLDMKYHELRRLGTLLINICSAKEEIEERADETEHVLRDQISEAIAKAELTKGGLSIAETDALEGLLSKTEKGIE